MNKLFIEIYLDENVDVLVAKIISSHGFDAITAQQVGNKGASDPVQLKYSSEHGRAILTRDRLDFEKLAKQYYEEGKSHAGIIVASDNSPQEIARRAISILNSLTADEVQNQIIYI